jgi:hypothetical protein
MYAAWFREIRFHQGESIGIYPATSSLNFEKRLKECRIASGMS